MSEVHSLGVVVTGPYADGSYEYRLAVEGRPVHGTGLFFDVEQDVRGIIPWLLAHYAKRGQRDARIDGVHSRSVG